ncbi:MAG TPA: NAD-dependent epimerase/dehydratase family protein [Anaeromyxobacter sp.]|nr:NAD-dependent epimerase/dehydratase family protein [Anaeromyxobacter sp.]
MRALVTGAGGFLGGALVRALLVRGDEVRALVRTSAPELERLEGVDVVQGDATSGASLRAAVRGCDVVFHLAGVRRATDPAEFMRVNAGSTRLALDACLAEAPGLSRFVLAGSLAAAGPSATPLREDAPLAPVEPYGASKAEAERIALSYTDRLPVAVARPPRIMGPGDRENLFFFRIAARGIAIGFTGGERPLSWIDVDDCARALLLLAERPEARGEAFFLASSVRTDAVAIQRAAARALGVDARTVRLPPFVVRGAAALADAITNVTGRRLPLNRKLAAQVLAPGWVCDPAKARDRLGFEARTPLAESIAAAAGWYRERGYIGT